MNVGDRGQDEGVRGPEELGQLLREVVGRGLPAVALQGEGASAQLRGSNGTPLTVTASIGVALFPAPYVESTEDLFARADEALYRAKSAGRTQIGLAA